MVMPLRACQFCKQSPALTPQPPLPILGEGEPNFSSPSQERWEKGLGVGDEDFPSVTCFRCRFHGFPKLTIIEQHKLSKKYN